MVLALLAVAALLAVLVGRLPRGATRALAAGGAVLALVSVALSRLRTSNMHNYGMRRWHSAGR